MPRWLEIALTLVVFSLVMLALSALVHGFVPGFVDWAWDRYGGIAVWAALIAFFAAALSYGIYDHRRAGTKPKGTYPRR